MAMQQSGGIYGAQMGLDIEYGSDPAAGGFFNSDYKKHEDLKQMLDSNKDGLKLEAMKRIIGMIARGRDASILFPAVVKNVVSKNIEVKKLVYVYLVRYAEEQQDLALLSISTFQRALKDPNQLIRASALRVLSSIRVPMIVPIVMLVIRESASDMSPYVRKTAAHAIPKLYSLDAEQKEELVSVIEKLLSDKTTLVVGSAVMAFEEVCPERVDLIHKNYRKLCNLLVDVDEWGQVTIINMLTRYARSQFTDPNDKEEDLSDENADDTDDNRRKSSYNLDSDHRLLLRQAKPLLQSHNASVVMAVSQLYFHIAPRNEIHIIAKALIRLLRSHKEIQSVVLTCIASLSIKHKPVIEPYLKSFFVRTMDPTHIKLLKLDILTNLANTDSISIILREFQTYISSSNRAFVGATIQAIGRCAATIKEVTETCLNGLVHLLSNSDEYVIAESVVVIKRLLQEKSVEHFEIISQMAKLLDFITVAAARSAIVWLIGEFNEKVPKIAPDVLRKLAKTFVDEKDIVKLQILNLAVKLYLTNPQQVELLSKYIFNLARYDLNYDIRDRARFLRQFIFPTDDKETILVRNAKKIFLSAKPAPTMESKYHGREKYQLGSLSHYMNMRANGYNNLPEFPTAAPDSLVRNVEGFMNEPQQPRNDARKKTFYADSEKNSNTDEDESDSGSTSESSSSSEEESGSESEAEKVEKKVNNISNAKKSSESEGSGSEDSESSSAYSGSSSSEETEEEQKTEKKINSNSKKEEEPKPKSNLDLLLDLDDFGGGAGAPVMQQSTPMSFGGNNVVPSSTTSDEVELVGPSFLHFNHTELMNKVVGSGLSLAYRFTRLPSLYSAKMVSIEFNIRNESSKDIENIIITTNTLPKEMKFSTFDVIAKLTPGESAIKQVGVDFNDSSHAIEFEVETGNVGKNRLAFKAPLGELIRSVKVSESYFNNERSKLRGMNEHTCCFANVNHLSSESICERVFQNLNVACVGKTDDQERFCGETLASKSLILISVTNNTTADQLEIIVNCEKMVVGSIILNEMKKCLS